MKLGEYHSHPEVWPRLCNEFQHSDHVLGSGLELIKYGWDPDGLLVQVEPVDQLWELAVNRNLQVFIPIFGSNGGDHVLWPCDYEVKLEQEALKIYNSEQGNRHYLENLIKPYTQRLEEILESRGIPYRRDHTPSGCHAFMYLKEFTRAYDAVRDIAEGSLEPESVEAYNYCDPLDIKRNPAIKLSSAKALVGLGLMTEYLGFLLKIANLTRMPITFSDSLKECVNWDTSWTWLPGYMRIIRAGFTGHKKRSEKYRIPGKSLVCAVGSYFDGTPDSVKCDDWGHLVASMWNMDRAIDNGRNYSGHIPVANDSLLLLIDDYKESDLFMWHQAFFKTPNWPEGEAVKAARSDPRLSDKTHSVLNMKHDSLLNPHHTKLFVEDFLNTYHEMAHAESAKFAASVMRDVYLEGHWQNDWLKKPAIFKANAMVRQFAAEILFEAGVLRNF